MQRQISDATYVFPVVWGFKCRMRTISLTCPNQPRSPLLLSYSTPTVKLRAIRKFRFSGYLNVKNQKGGESKVWFTIQKVSAQSRVSVSFLSQTDGWTDRSSAWCWRRGQVTASSDGTLIRSFDMLSSVSPQTLDFNFSPERERESVQRDGDCPCGPSSSSFLLLFFLSNFPGESNLLLLFWSFVRSAETFLRSLLSKRPSELRCAPGLRAHRLTSLLLCSEIFWFVLTLKKQKQRLLEAEKCECSRKRVFSHLF